MPSPSPKAQRLRQGSSRLLTAVGSAAHHAATRLTTSDGATLAGDRTVEWTFCFARLADGPGTTLDFGADTGFLSFAAAQRGHSVVALDRLAVQPELEHPDVRQLVGDILDRPLEGERFDQIINCSSVEHVGLAGRYGSGDAPDGDLEAMAILRERLADSGRMILTIPVGRDMVCRPFHRIYGGERLPRLLAGFDAPEEQYWRKDIARAVWVQTDRETALETEGSASFYSLGLFVLVAAGA
jgi:hypothetical protein